MKNIWFINQYITSPKMSNASHRHFSLSKYLAKENNIVLFTGSFSHLHTNNSNGLISTEENVKIVNLPIFKYNTKVGRILNFFDFVFKLRIFNYRKLEVPDIIVISTMSLFPLLLIDFYKKKFRNVKIVHEIRDIWPLTPIMIGGYAQNHPFIKMLSFCEKIGYNKADYFVSNLPRTDLHISKSVPHREKIPFTWISNGYDSDSTKESLPNHIISRIPKGKFLVCYAGTLGVANSIDLLVEVFLKIKKTNIHLCILGEGTEKDNLEKRASNNITFFDRIPKSQVQSFLSFMDVCILSCKKTELYKYGISPNKIFDYMNASKPIIIYGDVAESIIEKSKCGWTVPAENVDLLVSLLLKVSNYNKEKLEEYGGRGKVYLDKYLSYEKLAIKYQKKVFDNV